MNITAKTTLNSVARFAARTLMLALLLCFQAVAHAQMQSMQQLRLSVKVILNADGTWPHDLGDPAGNRVMDVIRAVEEGSRLLTHTGRNYRLDLLEIVELPGLHFWNVSESTTGDPEACHSVQRNFEEMALAFRSRYAYRQDAVNVYMFNCPSNKGGNSASLPADGSLVFLNSTTGLDTRSVLIHELGHHFGLRHTHNGLTSAQTRICGTTPYSDVWKEPGDDGLRDTLPDHPCWDLNEMSLHHFGAPYNSDLFPAYRSAVIRTYRNVMSYHDGNRRYILTPNQMEVWRQNVDLHRWRERRWESVRVTGLRASLTESQRNDARKNLVNAMAGEWVPEYGRVDVVDWLSISVPSTPVPVATSTIESTTLTSTGAASLNFVPDAFSDAAIARVPAFPGMSRQMTYSARLADEDRLNLRIAVYDASTQTRQEYQIRFRRATN